jgi:hypothetical protein
MGQCVIIIDLFSMELSKAHDFVIGQPNLKSKPDEESTVF